MRRYEYVLFTLKHLFKVHNWSLKPLLREHLHCLYLDEWKMYLHSTFVSNSVDAETRCALKKPLKNLKGGGFSLTVEVEGR